MLFVLLSTTAAPQLSYTTAAPQLSYTLLPGQKLSDTVVWHVSTYKDVCVIQRNAAPDPTGSYCCPYALVHLPQGQACPVGDVFNASTAEEMPWNPYPPGAQPAQSVFGGVRRPWYDLECANRTTAEQNTNLLNVMLASLSPGDTLSINGRYCLLPGVQASRLSHVTIDINGELLFGQGPKEWPQKENGGFVDAITFFGATNLTLTSSARNGSIRALSCTKWCAVERFELHLRHTHDLRVRVRVACVRAHARACTSRCAKTQQPRLVCRYLQRWAKGYGPGTMLTIHSDPNLTFASSNLLIEHVNIYDGPGYQTWLWKVVGLTVRYMEIKASCLPTIGTLTELTEALAQQTDGLDIFGKDVHVVRHPCAHEATPRVVTRAVATRAGLAGNRHW